MTSGSSLLDEVLPHYDVSAKYKIQIRATPEKIYSVLQGGFPIGAITKMLMALRRIPGYFQAEEHRGSGERPFYKLKQVENREIVIGIVGQFWKPASRAVMIQDLEEFLTFQQEGFCKAAMNLLIQEKFHGQCEVTTETRVLGYGSAKKPFKDYWRMIGPFSGLIRREILRKIKQKAEKAK
jgi:hypothetical protein